jgi:predicted transcriptional regulator
LLLLRERELERRSKHDIAVALLKAARLPTKKTHLMFKARLSFYQLQKYLPLLVENGLLRNRRIEGQNHDEIFYKTTEKGQSFVRCIELAEELWEA